MKLGWNRAAEKALMILVTLAEIEMETILAQWMKASEPISVRPLL